MTNSQLLAEALTLAERQGYQIRHDHLGGSGSGFYQLRDVWWLVVDVAQPVEEQLCEVARAIKVKELPPEVAISDMLAGFLAEC